MSLCMPISRCRLSSRGLCVVGRQPRSTCRRQRTSPLRAKSPVSEPEFVVGLPDAPIASADSKAQTGFPVGLSVAAVLLAGVVGRICYMIWDRRGSVTGLRDRGLITNGHLETSSTASKNSERFNNVNMVKIEELSDDAIHQARQRRRNERDVDTMDLEHIPIPANHPWATNTPVTQNDDELMKARLAVRRGLPLQDARERSEMAKEGRSSAGPGSGPVPRTSQRSRRPSNDPDALPRY